MKADKINNIKFKGELYKPYVNDHGIYVPVVYDMQVYDQCIITKEMFVEAYNKWIAYNTFGHSSNDDADCWCE